MAKDVVAVLEIVDIDERHGNGGVLLPEFFEGAGKAAAVTKPGKLVGKGSPDQILLPLEKVTDGLFERFGVIADSIHVLSGFLRSGIFDFGISDKDLLKALVAKGESG